jgi:hypothetical protein
MLLLGKLIASSEPFAVYSPSSTLGSVLTDPKTIEHFSPEKLPWETVSTSKTLAGY